MTRATGSFTITSGNEERLEERDGGARITRAWGEQTFAGDIVGAGAIQWLMSFRGDGSSRFVGLQRISGSLGDREGSFVIEALGDFDGAASKGRWTIVAGSGTGGLSGIRGSGSFTAPGGPVVAYELEYEVD